MIKWWILNLVLLLGLSGCARDVGEPIPEEKSQKEQVVSVEEEVVIWERAP